MQLKDTDRARNNMYLKHICKDTIIPLAYIYKFIGLITLSYPGYVNQWLLDGFRIIFSDEQPLHIKTFLLKDCFQLE